MHHSKPGLTYQPTNEEMDPTPDGSPHSRRRDEETGEPCCKRKSELLNGGAARFTPVEGGYVRGSER